MMMRELVLLLLICAACLSRTSAERSSITTAAKFFSRRQSILYERERDKLIHLRGGGVTFAGTVIDDDAHIFMVKGGIAPTKAFFKLADVQAIGRVTLSDATQAAKEIFRCVDVFRRMLFEYLGCKNDECYSRREGI